MNEGVDWDHLLNQNLRVYMNYCIYVNGEQVY